MSKKLKKMFDKHEYEFLKFDRIQNPAHRRPDMCAFIMLDIVVPAEVNKSGGYNDMVSAASHDEIYLETDVDSLCKVATDDLIIDLVRCGVRYDETHDCLAMFT